nr:hypothetical protein [Tanacetum cinerariifolium]
MKTAYGLKGFGDVGKGFYAWNGVVVGKRALTSLVYGIDQGKHVDVDGFVDADYAKDTDKGRSITGWFQQTSQFMRYAQYKSRFMRYVDTKLNRELLKKTIYEGPYIMTEISHQETLKDGDRPRVPGFTKKETYANTSPENRKLIDVEAEAVHMMLNGIWNDIYFIMDACLNAKEMWIEIKWLQ